MLTGIKVRIELQYDEAPNREERTDITNLVKIKLRNLVSHIIHEFFPNTDGAIDLDWAVDHAIPRDGTANDYNQLTINREDV